ncbi:WYL domain-containing protein [Gordonia sp. CPCC 206044]|uniref:helix-turn-helix transcriptional regulator n=1 Tax=Gordonia sp. CPCC 206044 TaxID=3140793 RepID=UPI003AF35493
MPVRLLRLLSMLQGSRDLTGAQLAERLDVSPRTVRNDIERLRELGYDIAASRGGIGGYRLGSGGKRIPPLLLDANEAVAVAVGLRTGVNCIIGGMEETSLRALTKLEGTLPAWLRDHVRSLSHFMVPLPHEEPVPITDPSRLTTLVESCRRRERFRFDYDEIDDADVDRSDGDGAIVGEGDDEHGDERPARVAPREVEPYRLVNRGHRWYLFGYDVDRADWQLFAVEQIRPRTPSTGPRFVERRLPAEDLTDYVSRRLPDTRWRHSATVTLHVPADDVTDKIASAEGVVTPVDEHTCRAVIGGETITAVAAILTRLDVDFTVDRSAELALCLSGLAGRYADASMQFRGTRTDTQFRGR